MTYWLRSEYQYNSPSGRRGTHAVTICAAHASMTQAHDIVRTAQMTIVVAYLHVLLQNPVYEVRHKYSEEAIQKFTL